MSLVQDLRDFASLLDEGIASDHPDIAGQTEFQRKAEKILAQRRKRRMLLTDPKARKAAEFFSKSVIGKRKSKVSEETMTPSDVKRENKLKTKYDKSGMKASMIKQYGPEKGKQIYFATIRKKAMKEWFDNEMNEEYKDLPARKMLKKAGKHKFYAGWVQGEWETNRFNKRKKAPLAKDMVRDASERADRIHDVLLSHDPQAAKAKSKYKSVAKEELEISEMKLPKKYRDPLLVALMKKLASHRAASYVKSTKKDTEKREKNIPRAALTAGYDYEINEAKISKTERRARNAAKPKRGSAVHAFDVDETLFGHGKKGKPDVKVHVNDSSGKRVQSLTNQEFNTHKLPKGHSYDFSEFRSAKKFSQTASPNKSMIKKVKKLQKRGKDVHLITARDKFDNPEAFRQHFARHGMNLKPNQIHYTGGMKGGDVGQKKLAVIRGLQKIGGAKKAHMYDDAAKVHKAMEKSNKETPTSSKIKTHLAKPNKKGEVMSRSYQTTKEEFALFVNALIDEGYNLDNYSSEDLIDIYFGLSEILDESAVSHGFESVYTKFYDPDSRESIQEEVEVTPYDYWKSFIDESNEELVSEINEETEYTDEKEPLLTSYDYWKAILVNQE